LFAEPEQRHDRFETVAVAQSAQSTPVLVKPARASARLYLIVFKAASSRQRGKVKKAVGKATGDTKFESEGKAQQVAGKVQNAIGGMKDAVKEAVDD
jgi:uncharacterized protein YjbJ (UPF0337 family)